MNCLDEMSIFAAFEIEGEEQGVYVFRVRSVGSVGVVSWSNRVSMTCLVKTDRQFLFYHTAPVVV
jgi:hypothetical protein